MRSADAAQATAALQHLATATSVESLRESASAVVAAVRPLLGGGEVDRSRRAAAFDVLARVGVPASDAAPLALQAFSLVNEPAVAAAAGRFLAALGEAEPRSGAEMVRLLEKIDLLDPIHRRALVTVMDRQGPPMLQHIPAVLKLSRQTSYYVDDFIRIRDSLARLGEPAIAQLLPLLRHEDAAVRLETVHVLSDMVALRPETAEALRERALPVVRPMVTDPDPEVAGAAGSFVRLLAALAAAQQPGA